MLRQRAAWHHLRTCNHFWKAERCKHTQHLTTWQQKSTVFIGLQNLEDAHWFTQCKPVPNNPKTYSTEFCWDATERSQSQIGSQDCCEDGKATSRHPIYFETSKFVSNLPSNLLSASSFTLYPAEEKNSPNGSSMQSSGRSRNYILFGWWSGWRVSASRMNK
jgi:hypothetical protein